MDEKIINQITKEQIITSIELIYTDVEWRNKIIDDLLRQTNRFIMSSYNVKPNPKKNSNHQDEFNDLYKIMNHEFFNDKLSNDIGYGITNKDNCSCSVGIEFRKCKYHDDVQEIDVIYFQGWEFDSCRYHDSDRDKCVAFIKSLLIPSIIFYWDVKTTKINKRTYDSNDNREQRKEVEKKMLSVFESI